MQNDSSTPDRSLSGLDFFFLWAGAGIALTEIWAGGLLAPLGLTAGLIVILLGHLLGNTPLALAGLIGSRHGVAAMASTRAALGLRGSILPAILNVIQLVGWTAVMLWVGGEAATRLSGGFGTRYFWIILGGALTTAWAMGGHRFWKKLQAVTVVLLILLSALMTYLAIRQYGWTRLLSQPAAGGLPFMSGLDLVIAMPISWIPLVADYARHAQRPRSAFFGTWLGYFVAGCWMYAVGLVVSLATSSSTPDAMIMDLMASYGLAAAALLIVVASTFTTTFLDIYSNALSVRSLTSRWSGRTVMLATGLLGTGLALVLNPLFYEGFLLLIGSAFCPLFGVVLVDYFVVRRGRWPEGLDAGRGPQFRLSGLMAWATGVAVYHVLARVWPVLGASLPSMFFAALLYLLLNQRLHRASATEAS
jgi:putative hydroxymethylpyrimidine transporter CytX